MSSELLENMRATTEAFIMSFEGQWSPKRDTLALRAPNCQHTIFPKSYGVPTKTNEQFAEYFKQIAHLFSEAKMTIDDYIAVPAERKTVSRSTMDAVTPVGPFHNEYVWIFTFDESGQKIVDIAEFFDSKAASEVKAKFKAAGLVPEHGMS